MAEPLMPTNRKSEARREKSVMALGTEMRNQGKAAPLAGDLRRGARLSIKDVTVEYDTARSGVKTALSGINLEVEAGQFVCVVGTSGCGKTTLLKAVDGLEHVSSGEISVDGKAVTKPGRSRAVVFQGASLLPWRTVLGNVSYGLEMQRKARGLSKSEIANTVQDLIELVGLRGFERSFPSELSGGMQQRVNLARALACDPAMLLLDEPFAALDAQTREDMQAELTRIWSETNKTAMFITHQIDEAVYLADRVVVMTARPGRIREVIDIDLPRPRPLEIKRDPKFVQYTDRIWRLIDEEGRKAKALDVDDEETRRAKVFDGDDEAASEAVDD
jgi:NitT/TauT family transport system ATP-binding protein